MIFEDFDPNVHDTRQVAELVFDVDLRIFRRVFKSKENAISAIEKKLFAEYPLFKNSSDFPLYVIFNKEDPSKLLGIILVSCGKNFNFLKEVYYLFKNLDFVSATRFTMVKYIDKKTLSKVNEEDLYIAEIATTKSDRCKGVGRAILQHVLDKAKELGYKRVVLDVDLKNNKALKLYESLGFKVFDKKKFQYGSHMKKTYNMEYVF
ncbi:N-acetyltransferase [uncultured Methanobrevibacter sp.]|uniref:GNAT family N-acetyltransferase n=1 Tax=uncultured Methanobrevibacter sp. TaxID=253161 RepID=UPI0025F1849B|nr:GNAT family N-acetyltransferase [uncultured Methanobrevibacter sp.]